MKPKEEHGTPDGVISKGCPSFVNKNYFFGCGGFGTIISCELWGEYCVYCWVLNDLLSWSFFWYRVSLLQSHGWKNPSPICLCCRHSETSRHHSCKTIVRVSWCFLFRVNLVQKLDLLSWITKVYKLIDFRISDWITYDLFSTQHHFQIAYK